MPVHVIEADPEAVRAQVFVEVLSALTNGGDEAPTRAVGEAFVSHGATMLVALNGREAVARALRELADHIEIPEPHGTA